ncbi:DUF3811 domain-containing protein [Lonsdalea populi]|uniref:DUF3811 domain-containing protein n=1 Tax=Lonsdalea populi TaxID=1172565 RepID=UPI000A231AED|nr:DUF3811 domain-containing protein [Lonsdalea populi]OSM99625.1 hypothetical protein AU508_01255 [Lonsdalea populi]RAT68244.1 hypothetical protein AU504_12960 [Lonsdalea populi]RAT72195.1 hypothetical protein AU505_07260 [Lonsdalea populi]RAT76151.1 hypothetical protein AU506_06710 [Lonsdalea populi]RAT79067.1 hypothetical protein AU507_05780 [Lonsdalea populi]
MPRLTQKDMTESEQRQLKTLLDQARKQHDRPLTNSENNHIKDKFIDDLMQVRDTAAKQARAEKKKNKFKPDTSATYQWSGNAHLRGHR